MLSSFSNGKNGKLKRAKRSQENMTFVLPILETGTGTQQNKY